MALFKRKFLELLCGVNLIVQKGFSLKKGKWPLHIYVSRNVDLFASVCRVCTHTGCQSAVNFRLSGATATKSII